MTFTTHHTTQHRLFRAHGVSMTFTTHHTTQHSRCLHDLHNAPHNATQTVSGLSDACALVPDTDFKGGDILPESDHLILPSAAECCAACQNHSGEVTRHSTCARARAHARTRAHTPCTTFSHHAAPPPIVTTLFQLFIQARAQRLDVNCGAGGRPHRAAVRQGAT
jgi:hypothetical protein